MHTPTLLSALVAFAASTALAGAKMSYTTTVDQQMQIAVADAQGRDARVITEGPDLHVFPDISADGRYVAYAGGPDQAHLAIEIRDLETGVVEEYETAHGQSLHVSFSGDGRWLVYSSPRGAKSALVLVDLADARAKGLYTEIQTERGPRRRYTGTPRLIQEDGNNLYFPSLSSDGSFVIYHRSKDAARKEAVKLDLESGEKTTLTPVDGYIMAPSLSFDDRRIVYFTRIDGQGDIVMQDLQGQTVTRLTNDAYVDGEPVFRPDGSVVFVSKRGDHFGLYEIRAADMRRGVFQTHELLRSDQGDIFAAQFSGDTAVRQTLYPSINEPARSSFGAVRVGDKIYIAGGHQGAEHTYPPQSFVDAVEIFDLSTKSWSTAAPRPVASQGFMLASHGKYIYAFGGFAYAPDKLPRWRSLDVIDRYDTERNVWETIGHMPRRRSSYVLGQLGAKVWIIGGWDATPKFENDLDGSFHREIDVFDLETETMSTTGHQLPDPLRRAFSAVTHDGEILLAGGIGEGASHFELLDQVTAFDPATGAWRELPRLPFATFAPAAGVMDGSLFVFGGMFKTGPLDYRYVKHAYELPLSSPGARTAWVHVGRYLRENKGFSQVVELPGGELGILGGHSYDGATDAPVRTFEIFGR
jgi:hypothetical protein